MRPEPYRFSHVDKFLRSLVILFFLLGTGSSAAAGDGYALFLPMMSMNWVNTPGNIYGVVSDAVNLQPVDGVSVCYRGTCTLTNGLGEYTLTNLPPVYVVLDATKDTYIAQSTGITVFGNQTVILNIVISQELKYNDVALRFILTWRTEQSWPPDSIENDLDSHVWISALLPWHIDPSDNRGSCVNYPYACVEVDARTGSGPETVDIRQLQPNTTYYYGVLNYNAGYAGVPPITESKAKVQVFDTSGLIHTYNVPTIGSGELWYVFMINSSGILTPTNCITTLPPDVPPGDPIMPPQCP
jgi:hypothetical protein